MVSKKHICLHLKHSNRNIPYNLIKRIIVFVIDDARINERLSELKTKLLSCSYPSAVTEKDFLVQNYSEPGLKKRIDIPFVPTHTVTLIRILFHS